MGKKVEFNESARRKLKLGVDTLANAVKVTLGPKGKNVILDRDLSVPHITKDGVTVAMDIDLDDKIANMGAQLVKNVASKTADAAGDGTTTATVLTQAIFSNGIKNLAAGANPMDLKRGIDKAVVAVVEHLKAQSKPVSNHNELINVATISANSDKEIGEVIAMAVEKVGKDGAIRVDDAFGYETTVETIEGMEFARGYIHPHFVTNQLKMTVEYDNPLILLCEKKISHMKDIVSLFNHAAANGRAFVVIAEDVDGEGLATLVVNKIKAGQKVVAIKAPEFGKRSKLMLEDIAVRTGAKVISEDSGMLIREADYTCLGTCEKIIVSASNTTIIGGVETNDRLLDRINSIKGSIENTTGYEQMFNRARLAKITGKVAVINVGAATEVEAKEKKDRIDDALHATRAAVEEGILPGGGTAYIKAMDALDGLIVDNQDQATGVQIVKLALMSPAFTIAENAGVKGDVVVNTIKSFGISPTPNLGYNASTDRYENMLTAGIIDPTKVVRLAIENAASIAGLLLTTDAVIYNSDPREHYVEKNPGEID